MKKILALAFLFATALAGASNAALVNVDFGGGPLFSGTGVAGGGTWNSYGGAGASGSLLDSTGAASGVTFYITSSFGNTDSTGGTNPATNPATAALFEDYIRTAFNNNLAVTFSGLVPLQTYDLTIYASGAATGTGAVFSANFPGSTTGADRLAFVLGDNYMRHNVTADSMGMITVSASPMNGDGAVFNGLQIATVVPEPATWAWFAGGFAGLWTIQRRRSAAIRPGVR